MIVPPAVRRAFASWQSWRVQQRLYRAFPELRDIDAQERAARASHKPVRPIQRQRQALMTDMLRRSVG